MLTTVLHTQIPLELSLRTEQRFDNYVATRNELVVHLLNKMASEDGEKQILIWGGKGAGKSHLLNAVANTAFKNKRRVFMMPFNLVKQAGGGTDLLEGMSELDVLCLDDVDKFITMPGWETAIFELVNQARGRGCRLVFSAQQRPERLAILLPDLVSRLQWGPVIQLLAPDDATLEHILNNRAKDMGLELGPGVCSYLLKRLPRDTASMLTCIQELGRESLSSQRHINIRLTSQLLSTNTRLAAFLARHI